ncbi:hypothetical protein D3C76_1778380 [compost metagenome]
MRILTGSLFSGAFVAAALAPADGAVLAPESLSPPPQPAAVISNAADTTAVNVFFNVIPPPNG